MGERGPVPIPYARRRNPRRPGGRAVTVARPPMPRDLPLEAKDEWRRVVPLLEEMGVLTSVDRAVLISYCTTWADWCDLDRLLQRSTKLIRGQKGNLVRNPLWMMRRDAEQMLVELRRQLGLTPVARLRAGVVHEQPEDPDAESPAMVAIAKYRRRLGADGHAGQREGEGA